MQSEVILVSSVRAAAAPAAPARDVAAASAAVPASATPAPAAQRCVSPYTLALRTAVA